MPFRLVGSLGDVKDAAMISMAASGTIHPGEVVDFLRTSGQGVSPAGMDSTVTTIFGVAMDYVQGASDVYVRVIPFQPGQLWEADCVGAASTAHVGMRFALDRQRATNSINNVPVGTDSLLSTAIFQVVGMTGSTSGSGKVLGFFRAGMTVGVPTNVGTNSAY